MQCPVCEDGLFKEGQYIECDTCGYETIAGTEHIIAELQENYPGAVITEKDGEIHVEVSIELIQPVKKIYITGVVTRD